MSQHSAGTTSARSRFRAKLIVWFGWCGALTFGCGLDSTLLLRTTEYTATGGGANAGVGGSAASTLPVVQASPFCSFMWGRHWGGTSDSVQSSGDPAYPTGLDMMAIWTGYEPDDTLNAEVQKMLRALRPSGDTALNGVVPVLYAYLIPFKARVKNQLQDCAPNNSTPNICTEGALWIRNNRDYLRQIYASYAEQIAAIWGTQDPLIWLFEPDFHNYIRTSQTEPLTLNELSIVASDLIGTVKARLPNAIVSHYASPSIADFNEYFGAFDLSLVDMVNVTGSAQYDYFASGNSGTYPQSTYRRLHEATGLPIFVDTGFDDSKVTDSGWLTVSVDVMNQRISDGVVAVLMKYDTSTLQSRIDTVSSELNRLNCDE